MNNTSTTTIKKSVRVTVEGAVPEEFGVILTKGKKQLVIDTDYDLIATREGEHYSDFDEYILNLERDFDLIWSFLKNHSSQPKITRDYKDMPGCGNCTHLWDEDACLGIVDGSACLRWIYNAPPKEICPELGIPCHAPDCIQIKGGVCQLNPTIYNSSISKIKETK